MVHALKEIHRTLTTNGILIDLRPLADRWLVEVVSGRQVHVTGRLTDLPAGLSDDNAANGAVKESVTRGWFIREQEQFFPAYLYWDDPDEMSAYIAERWTDFVKLEEDTLQAAQASWNTAGEDKRVRIKLKMLLTRWRKQ
jgi:hypothetical protein